METFILAVHIIACVFLVILVLLQSGQEGMGVIFGGGSNSMFGSAGAGGLIVKITAVLAATFLVTSLAYNVISGNKVVDESSLMMSGDGIISPAPEKDAKPVVAFEEEAQQETANTVAQKAEEAVEATKEAAEKVATEVEKAADATVDAVKDATKKSE